MMEYGMTLSAKRVLPLPSIGPIYFQVAREIQGKIERKEIRPGQQLPSEPELARVFSTSRPTIRQALQVLVEAGMVYRARGRGTFVRKRLVESTTYPVMGFSEQIRLQGQVPSARILSVERCRAVRVSRRLGMPSTALFTRIKRLQLADGEIIALNTYYVVHTQQLVVNAADLGSASLYEYLSKHHGLKIAESARTIRAGLAAKAEARHLGVAVGSALLLVERVDYRSDGTPIGYAESQVRGDRYAITTYIFNRT
jgi:GntR family transcriptional regulator